MERRMLLSANLVWNPQAGSDVWDYSTPNWIDTASNMPTVFHDGDEVSFGDRGAGTVLIDANGVAPGSTTVDSSLDYSFNGAATDGTGGINGAGTLVKDGTGNLAVFNVNAYSGSTLVDAGSLAVDYGTLGSGDGTVTVADGATLELVRIDGRTTPQLSNPLVLNGMGVNSEGALVSGGSVNYLYSGPITAVSASKINSAQGGIELSGSIDDEAGLTLDGDGQTLIDGAVTGPGGINKVGTGTAVFGGPGKTYSGPTGVVSGTLEDGGGASGELSPNSRYTVAAGATLHDFGFDTIGSLAGAGTVTTVASITVGADNSDSTFSGVMTGGVIKIGTGTFTLAGDQPNGLSRLDISGGTVVLDKSDGVAAIEPQAQSINDGIYIESGGLRWAASNQLSPTEQIVGQPIGPADIDVGVYTDSCYSLSGGNGGTIHIGTGGALNVADFAISSYPVTWNIDQGAALNLLDGGAGYSDVARLGLVDATVNIAGTINIGNSPGLTAVVFDGGAAVVTPTGTINTGSGAVVFQSNIDIPADQNPPNLVVQSGGQMNLGRFGDNASLRLLGHQEGGAQVDQGSLLIESGATVNMEGAQSRIEELGGQDAITGTGTINLFGGNRTIDARGELIISANVINGTMTKIGNGPLALAGSNSFSGPSTIQAGILVLGSDPALANTTHVYVEDGATLDLNGHAVTAPIDAVGGGAPTGGGAIANFSRAFTDLGGPSAPATVRSTLTLGGSTSFAGDLPITLAGQVTGPGEITVADGGAVLVFTNSSNDYTGGTNNIPPNWGAGDIEVSAPHALGVGALRLAGGVLTMDGPTDQIDASVVSLLPTAAFGPPNLILNGPAPADSYTLINNTGGDAVAGTFNNLPQGASLAVSGKAFYINYKGGDGNDVVITTSPVPQNLVWNPQGGSDVWDYTTPNWLNIDSNTQTVFRDGDNVTFNDLSQGDVDIIGGGTTSTPQSVAPASTSFANNNDYSLFGGSLAGPGGLTKSGAGDLALSSNCTYAGSTDVNGGRLILGVAALPDLTAVTVSAGATLVDRGDGALFNGVEATIGSLAGSGTVVLDSFQWALITGANNSSTTFSGIISGNTELAKVGAGTFTIAGDQPNTFYKLDIGYFTPSGSAINGGTVVLDKADGVTAVGAEPGAANNGITVYAGNLTWAADNQLLTTDDVGAIGQSCGIDLGSHTDTFANLGLGADTFHIGSGGVLNLVDSAWGDEAPATWTIDQGAALNFLDGGSAPYVNYRLALGAGYGTSGPVDLNVAGTINIGNSPGIDAASFGDATVNVTGTGSINTGSGAVAVAGNVTLPASENPPNVIVQSGGQINIGKFGDGGSLQLLGHQEGGAVDNPGSLFLDTGATLNMEGDSSIREIGGHLDDAIHGGGIIDLFGAEHMVSAGDVNSGLTISVNIVDGTLTKSGPGWLALSGSNQFDGATTIQQGMLVLESDSALGNTTHVYIDDGGTLELHGHNISAPIDATGIGSQSRGALSNSSNSFWGPGQPATITGTLTLSGTVGVDGDEPIHLDGQVTGTGEISLGNFPTLVLSNSANDYTGGNTNANRAFGAPTFDVAAPHALGTGVLSLIGGFLTLDSPSDQVTASSVSLAPANLGGSVGLPNLIVNGPAPADSYTLVNNTGSAAVAGTFNDLPQGASLTIGGKTFYINYKGGDGNDVVITTSPVQNSVQNVQGMVWADFNNDGNVDFGEQGISGVPITLIGSSGQLVATTSTDSNGLYSFNNVPPDVYSISEGGSPSGYVEGKDTLGSITDLEGNLVASSVGDASVQDLFSGVPVGINENAINYNFGEQPAAGSAVSKGQAATMGFWQNKNGQALINEFNSIGPWLAATMPQTFGSLASASPQQVATLYQQKFVLTDKLDAQVMATALNVYATDASLGGSAATSYGFAVSTYGLGDSTWNVGSDGGALDAADNSTLTVLQILQDWDQEPDKTSRSIRQMAIDIFGGINKTGNI